MVKMRAGEVSDAERRMFAEMVVVVERHIPEIKPSAAVGVLSALIGRIVAAPGWTDQQRDDLTNLVLANIKFARFGEATATQERLQ